MFGKMACLYISCGDILIFSDIRVDIFILMFSDIRVDIFITFIIRFHSCVVFAQFICTDVILCIHLVWRSINCFILIFLLRHFTRLTRRTCLSRRATLCRSTCLSRTTWLWLFVVRIRAIAFRRSSSTAKWPFLETCRLTLFYHEGVDRKFCSYIQATAQEHQLAPQIRHVCEIAHHRFTVFWFHKSIESPAVRVNRYKRVEVMAIRCIPEEPYRRPSFKCQDSTVNFEDTETESING